MHSLLASGSAHRFEWQTQRAMAFRKIILSVATLVSMSMVANAQNFSSGSTGADGPLDLSTLSCVNCIIQVPASGVFNSTTINIPSGKQLSFISNLRNTPVIMLAQGNVVIAGQLRIQGNDDTPGPGGFAGASSPNQAGFGPGGGQPDPTQQTVRDGKWIGPTSLVPTIGGSGGAYLNARGGGGGGAIVIASSSSISVTGTIDARGACTSNGQSGAQSGRGSGGSIRLISNSVTVSGFIFASGGCSSAANPGVIRIECPSGSFTGQAMPAPILSSAINPLIFDDNSIPSLVMTSIGGFPVPNAPAARSDFVDLMLPSQLNDPISVVVHGHNLPIGTTVRLSVGGSNATVTSATLSGTFDSSTATLNVSGLNRASVSTLFVFATFDISSTAQTFNPKGPNHVARIGVEARLGQPSQLAFLRSNGTKIDLMKLPPQFLRQFNR